jgi:hypothetical protein
MTVNRLWDVLSDVFMNRAQMNVTHPDTGSDSVCTHCSTQDGPKFMELHAACQESGQVFDFSLITD